MDIKEIAVKIENGDISNIQIELGSSFGRELEIELVEKFGWGYAKSYSYCKVATFESHLKKNDMRVKIISSYLFGAFTTISVIKEA